MDDESDVVGFVFVGLDVSVVTPEDCIDGQDNVKAVGFESRYCQSCEGYVHLNKDNNKVGLANSPRHLH